jgi:outer membrane protein assembly factor BamB
LFTVILCGGADWRQFRGNAHNTAVSAKLPATWDIATKKNVQWQIDLPGRGPSSPILIGDRVIVTASDGALQNQLYVLCIDAASGKELWRRRFWATGRTYCHPESAIAAPTPASDGKRIFAFYSSNDLACLDLDGNLLWYRGLAYDYPKAGNDVGMSSSPVIVGDTVVVQIDCQGDAFVTGLDAATGEPRWRVDRTKLASWSSPVAAKSPAGGDQVVLQDIQKLMAYSPRDGKELWKLDLPGSDTTSIAVADQTLFVPSNGVTALDLSTSGAAPAEKWNSNRIGTSGASPVVANGAVYSVNRAGVLTCADAKSGDVHWQLRLKGPVWSTPIVNGRQLYLINFDGLAQFVKLGEKPSDKAELIGSCEFGEHIQGTPAVGDAALYVRSDKHLWKIAE